jgi:hypothetical protein
LKKQQDMKIKSAVAVIVFNRPQNVERVLEKIAQVRPPKLFIAADGPRADHPEDVEKCQAVRAVFDRVDWECKVFRRFSDRNLGCGNGPARGISWVFRHVNEAIILEDDCIPNTSFFRFTDELLSYYRHNPRVMMIGGGTYQFGRNSRPYSYYFSQLPSCWLGWGTWRRAWNLFDINIEAWPKIRETPLLKKVLRKDRFVQYWNTIFNKAYDAPVDSRHYWDYQWILACWANEGLAALPHTNMVANIGFDGDATHTKNPEDSRGKLPTRDMEFPLMHPPDVVADRNVDRFRYERILKEAGIKKKKGLHTFLKKMKSAIRKTLANVSS